VRRGVLDGVEMRDGRLHVTPVRASTPPGARGFADRIDASMPPVRITELLHEVNRAADFGRPATDQQMRMYMKLRCHHPQRVAAAKAGFSERTGRRIEGDPQLPSEKSAERPLRRKVADPLGSIPG
jgi:hypothetical protein